MEKKQSYTPFGLVIGIFLLLACAGFSNTDLGVFLFIVFLAVGVTIDLTGKLQKKIRERGS